jgi:hypothetical protein
MRGKKAGTKCPHCYEEEDIHQMAFDCTIARYIRKIACKEWSPELEDPDYPQNQGEGHARCPTVASDLSQWIHKLL